MTDGVLLREVGEDLLLSKYSAIVLDEAHERGINTDLLLGLLSRIVRLRADATRAATAAAGQAPPLGPLKLIIMSATLQVDALRANATLFPSPPPVLTVNARQFPVTVHFARKTPEDHLEAAYKKVARIHCKLPPGGILVFLTGQREIEELCTKLRSQYGRAGRAVRPSGVAGEWGGAESSGAGGGGAPGADMDAAAADVTAAREAAQRAIEDVSRLEASGASAPLRGATGLIGEEEEEDERGFGEAGGDAEGGDASAKLLQDDDEAEDGGDRYEEAGGEEDDDLMTGGPLLVLPLYSMLPAARQMQVFSPPPDGTRLVVVATNVAETSITIPGIRYVVDAGKHKQRTFDERGATSRYDLAWVSKASADQRAGRAGRVGPGHCYRLYSSAVLDNYFPAFSSPEICRVPVEGVVLQMKAMGIVHVRAFPFPEPPAAAALEAAQHALRCVGALGATAERRITELGRVLARLPISARLGKLIVVGRHDGLLHHALPLAAMLAQQDPHAHMGEDGTEGQAAEAAQPNVPSPGSDGAGVPAAERRPWACAESDALSLIGLYHTWLARGGGDAAAFALQLIPKVMREAQQLHQQLGGMLRHIFPDDPPLVTASAPPSSTEAVKLRRALTAALPDRVARLASLCDSPHEQQLLLELSKDMAPALLRRAYLAAEQGHGQLLWLRPGSRLATARPRPRYVCFFEVQCAPTAAHSLSLHPAYGPAVACTPSASQPSPAQRRTLHPSYTNPHAHDTPPPPPPLATRADRASEAAVHGKGERPRARLAFRSLSRAHNPLAAAPHPVAPLQCALRQHLRVGEAHLRRRAMAAAARAPPGGRRRPRLPRGAVWPCTMRGKRAQGAQAARAGADAARALNERGGGGGPCRPRAPIGTPARRRLFARRAR